MSKKRKKVTISVKEDIEFFTINNCPCCDIELTLKMPIEFQKDFEKNPIKTLNSIAGISSHEYGKYVSKNIIIKAPQIPDTKDIKLWSR